MRQGQHQIQRKNPPQATGFHSFCHEGSRSRILKAPFLGGPSEQACQDV